MSLIRVDGRAASDENSHKTKSSKFKGVNRIAGRDTFQSYFYDNRFPDRKAVFVYLGNYEDEEEGARAHDLASLKVYGTKRSINFPISDYKDELALLDRLPEEEALNYIKRSNSKFSSPNSIYGGVFRTEICGAVKWAAKGSTDKISYNVGYYDTQEEAAMAYDFVAIKQKGSKAVTNFDMRLYDVEAIVRNPIKLPIVVDKNVAKLCTEATLFKPFNKNSNRLMLDGRSNFNNSGQRGNNSFNNAASSSSFPERRACISEQSGGDAAAVVFKPLATRKQQLEEASYNGHDEFHASTVVFSNNNGAERFWHSSSSSFKKYEKNDYYPIKTLALFPDGRRHRSDDHQQVIISRFEEVKKSLEQSSSNKCLFLHSSGSSPFQPFKVSTELSLQVGSSNGGNENRGQDSNLRLHSSSSFKPLEVAASSNPNSGNDESLEHGGANVFRHSSSGCFKPFFKNGL